MAVVATVAAGIVGLALTAAPVTDVDAAPQPQAASVQASSVVPGLPGGFSLWQQRGGLKVAVLRKGNSIAIHVFAEGGGSCFTGTLSPGRASGFSREVLGRGGQFTRLTMPVHVGKSGLSLGAGSSARIRAGTAMYRMVASRMLPRLNECRTVAGRGGVYPYTGGDVDAIFHSVMGQWPWEFAWQMRPVGLRIAVSNRNYGYVWGRGLQGPHWARRTATGWHWISGLGESDPRGSRYCRPSSMRRNHIPATVQRDFIATGFCKPTG